MNFLLGKKPYMFELSEVEVKPTIDISIRKTASPWISGVAAYFPFSLLLIKNSLSQLLPF
jgi:hypothetical protein